MCLAFADAGFTKNGVDQVAYDIYGPTGNNDVHSVTCFNTFVAPVGMTLIEIENNETHEKIIFGHKQKIWIKKDGLGDEIMILGEQFQPNDLFIRHDK